MEPGDGWLSRRMRPAGRGSVVEVPVADVRVDTFAPDLAVGTEREHIYIAVRARRLILVVVAPRIFGQALEITAGTPVFYVRIIGLLNQRLESFLAGRVGEIIQ